MTVNGKPTKEKVKLTMPAETQAALHALEGKSFTSAKDFVAAFYHAGRSEKMDTALITRARDYY